MTEDRMSLFSTLLIWAPGIAFRHSALRVLASRVPLDEARSIIQNAKKFHKSIRGDRPRHSFGVNFMMRYFEWNFALYLALKKKELPSSVAGQIVEETNWEIFGALTSLLFMLSRLQRKKPLARVRSTLDLMFGLLFASPFERVDHPSTDSVFFHVTSCPFADYFHDRGVPELTKFAACNLDFRMAAQWRVTLHREQTLAEGFSHCDFRFEVQGRDEVKQPHALDV